MLLKKNIYLCSPKLLTRSSSWPRTPGFHPGNQGFESPTGDQTKEKKNMATHKSAFKRIRSTQKRRDFNRYYSKTMRNAIRDFRKIEKKEEADKEIISLISLIDRNAKRGIIHKNKAANLKSKITKKLNSL